MPRLFPLLFLFLTAVSCRNQTARQSSTGPTQSTARASLQRPRIIIGDVLGQPKLVKYVRAEYPEWARRQGLQGTVELTATINKNGDPQDLTFVKGPGELRRSAENAVRKWRYEPCNFKGLPVECRIYILVPFTLTQ